MYNNIRTIYLTIFLFIFIFQFLIIIKIVSKLNCHRNLTKSTVPGTYKKTKNFIKCTKVLFVLSIHLPSFYTEKNIILKCIKIDKNYFNI